MENRNDFDVCKFYVYKGPNYYLNKKALVFNIYLDPEGPEESYYVNTVYKIFPALASRKPSTVIDLFACTLMQAIRMDIDFYLKEYSLREDGEEFTVAVEFYDERIAEGCVHLVSNWFKAMNEKADFDFVSKWRGIPEEIEEEYVFDYDKMMLFTAASNRNIPFFLVEDYLGMYQLGYGKKQLTGDLHTFSTDSMTDYSVFRHISALKYLEDTGFLAIKRKTCYTEDEAVETALKLGFPIEMIPDSDEFNYEEMGVVSEDEVRNNFKKFMKGATNEDGVVVRKSNNGWNDYKLTTVAGKLVAAVQFASPMVTGNGRDSIKTLIEAENNKRYSHNSVHNFPAALNEKVTEYLSQHGLSIDKIPAKGEKIKVNDSTQLIDGAKTINVNARMHPANMKLIEFYAKLFNLKCLLFEVEAQDIAEQWNDDNYEINDIKFSYDGNVIFYRPMIGERIDLEGAIIDSHFSGPGSARIPIIIGNNIPQRMADSIYKKLKAIKDDIYFGSLTSEGVSFNGNYFFKNDDHDKNVKTILRNHQTEFALFCHNMHDINDYGFFHEGADLAVLDNANETEEAMKNLLTEKDYLIEINDHQIELSKNGDVVSTISFYNEEDKEKLLMTVIEPLLQELVNKYV
jgi:cyanophycin synthetase